MSGSIDSSTACILSLAFVLAACSQQEKPDAISPTPTQISIRECIKLANEQSEKTITARYETRFATREAISKMSDTEREQSFIQELTLQDKMRDEVSDARRQNAQACKADTRPLLITGRAP